ncbi:MAG: diguanylate cyclase [Lachnospiraceae bacterium]|nr:diguanylate cyclase [Lachnospiraceae bacterium]
MKSNNTKKTRNIRLQISVGISFVVAIMFMMFLCKSFDFEPDKCYYIKDWTTVDVYYADGTSASFEDTSFGSVGRGDKLVLHVNIPESLGIRAAELFIPIYNTYVDVDLQKSDVSGSGGGMEFTMVPEEGSGTGGEGRAGDDGLGLGGGYLYSDDTVRDYGTHYGNYIYEVPLPGNYEDRELTIYLECTVTLNEGNLDKLCIINANEGWKLILKGNVMVFALALSLMVMSLAGICYFLITSIRHRNVHPGLPISLFELLICAWFFGSMKMFYLLFDSAEFCSKVEYYSLYLAPLVLVWFIYTVVTVPFHKRFTKVAMLAYFAYYMGATVLEFLPVTENYSSIILSMHIMAGITIIVMMIALFFGTKTRDNPNIIVLKYGVMASMACGVLELVRYNIARYITETSWISTGGFSTLAIIIIAMSLVIYLISYSAHSFTEKVEKEQLLRMAFTDTLTGMPNRASCYRNIEKMEADDRKEYSIVFIDLNNLKKANDGFGHDMGDKLLMTTARHIVGAFEEKGFTARWGGDEFVACVFGSADAAAQAVSVFEKRMSDENASGEFPFEVSAACGIVSVTGDNYIAPIEAIRQADEIMYENKKQMKAKR